MPSFHKVEVNGVDISSKPCRVTEVEFKGLQRTQAHVIERQLDAVHRAKTLAELYTALHDVIADLTQLDVFSAVDVSIAETKRVCGVRLWARVSVWWLIRGTQTPVVSSLALWRRRFGR